MDGILCLSVACGAARRPLQKYTTGDNQLVSDLNRSVRLTPHVVLLVLQRDVFPRALEIDEDITSLQADVASLAASTDAENRALEAELQRLTSLVTTFHRHMEQILPGLASSGHPSADAR